jgi:hypothetical protein
MANFFSLQDGSLTDISTYGYSLTGLEILNNTTGTMLLTSTGLYSASVNSDGSTLSAIALHLSARSANPTGTLGLTLQQIASAGTFIDSSSNNSIVTTVGSAFQNTFSPFSPNGWSGNFNGSTDYLNVSSSLFAFGTNNFTVEFWIYPLEYGSSGIGPQIFGTTNGSSNNYSINLGGDQNNFRILSDASGATSGGAWANDLVIVGPNLNEWTHMAVVRDGANLTIYKNGLSAGQNTNAAALNYRGNVAVIGRFSDPGATRHFRGSISNLRVVTSALYTSNFTPPTAALTNIANTALLTLQDNRFRDKSNNNYRLSAFGSVSIKDTSPFPPVAINPDVHGGAGFFRNTYLTITSQPSLSFGTGDFTVEAWVYPLFNLGQYEAICAGTESTGFSLQTQVANDNKICITTTTAQILAGTIPLSTNQWNHVAATRSSGRLLLYINGLSSAQVNGNTTNFAPITFIAGGTASSNQNVLKNSYVSNFRVVKGTALYTTASFAPSTSPLTNIAGTSLLLNTDNYGLKNTVSETYAVSSFTGFDGSNNLLTRHPQNWQILKLTNPLSTNRGDVINFTLSTSNPNQLSLLGAAAATDTTGITRLSTVGTPLLTSFKPYPNFDDSYYLNGTTDWFTVPANPRFILDGDFTIECWVNTAVFSLDASNHRNIFGWGANATNNLRLMFAGNLTTDAPTQKLNIYAGTGTSFLLVGTIDVADGNWHHVAISRYNNALRLYVDGIQSGPSLNNTTNFNAGATNILSIGAHNNSAVGRLSAAYINNFRIVNGTAVYTTSSFSPPTSPLTVIPNTVFLMENGARYDQALISNQIIKTGNLILNGTQLSSANPFGVGVDSSIKFNGNGDYIQVLYKNSNWSTSNYSLEFWFYWTGGTGQQRIFSNTTAGLQLGLAVGGSNMGLYDGSTGATFGASPSKNVWHHFYINRSSGTLRAFLNGTQIFTGSDLPNVLINTFTIGGEANNSHSFGGFLSNLRISNKPFYTPVNNTITIPTRPLDPTDIVNNGANFLINTNSYNLSSFYDFESLDDIHIGSSLKGINREDRTLLANSYGLPNLYIHNKGTLNFPLTSNTTLSINGSAGLQITSDGTLNIGTSSSVIPLSTTHTIILSNTQIDVHNGGNFNVYGYPELTTTNLVSTHPIGSRIFTTTSNVSSDWRVGDILSFKPNLSSRRSFDELILSSFLASNVFTTTSSSLCAHTGSADEYAFVPDVYNLTRNVIIRGLSSTNRGVIRAIDAAKTSLNYVQLSNFGINSVNKNGFVIGNNLSGSTTLSGATILSDNQSYIRNILPLTGRLFQNASINNSIINKSNLLLSSLSANNINFSNNYILSSNETGLQMNNLSGSINMSNNTTIGSLSYGSLLVNNTLTGTYGGLNYNSGLQGMLVSGANTGTIIGGSINSPREGVYVDASTSNLSGLTFQNILANNNGSDGFTVSGNNLNYLTPLYLNINGLTASNNLSNGFEAFNITGNLSSLVTNNNIGNNIKTSIGNGPTTINGLTSLANNSPTISSGIAFLGTTSAVSSLSAPSYSGSTEGSLYFSGNAYLSLPTVVPNVSGIYTIEFWIYIQSYPSNWIAFTYDTATNRNNAYSGIYGINNSGFLNLYWYRGGIYNITSTSAVSLSSWTHCAICVSTNRVNYYINGANVTPASNNITPNFDAPTLVNLIGSTLNSETNQKFYISNYRISNILRYTGSFVPPTFPLTNYTDANILLLYGYPYTNTFLTSSIYTNNLNVSILSGYNYSKINIIDAYIGKFNTYYNPYSQLIMDSVRFSNFSLQNSIVTGGTYPLQLDTTRNLIEGSYLFNNTFLGNTPLGTGITSKYQSNVFRNAGFAFTNLNKISAYNITYLVAGSRMLDYVTPSVQTADIPSERLTPNSRTIKLRSGSKFVAVNAVDTTTVSVYVRLSILSDGTAYNGNPPRLMLKQNSAVGVLSDRVLAQLDSANNISGSYVELTGSTPTAIDDGVFEFYVDCDGTAGWINIDNWNAS